MKGHKKALATSLLLLSVLVSVVVAVNWHQLFEVHTEVTAEEGVHVCFASVYGGEWYPVIDASTYYATLKAGDVERFYLKIQHEGDTAITLKGKMAFPPELELYATNLPEGVSTWWEDSKYFMQYTMEQGIIGDDYAIWIEYRLVGWAELETYTLDFTMWRG